MTAGAKLQALEAHHAYKLLLKWKTKNTPPILQQEKPEDAKNRIQQATGLDRRTGNTLQE